MSEAAETSGPIVPALLVMHGSLAEAFVRAAERVYGPVDGIEVVSNEGLSRDALAAEIARRVERWTSGGLILTDFRGGSCHSCGAIVARSHDVIVLTGCNLAMLLDYLHNRGTHAKDALAERLVLKGRDSIRLHGQPA